MIEASQSKVPNAQNKTTSQKILTQKINQNNISNLLKKTGGFGKYQKISLILLFLGSCICGQLSSITPYLYYQDQYQCSDVPSRFSSCVEYVCSFTPQRRIAFIGVPSMNTLPVKFGDYRCPDTANLLNTSILIMFLGTVIAHVFIASFGDFIGRKAFILIGALVGISGIGFSLLAKDLFVASLCLAVGAFGLQIVFNIGFNIISQIVHKQNRHSQLVRFQCFYSFGQLVNVISFFFVKDWQNIFIFFFIIPMAFFFVAYLLLTVDTPMCLIKNLTPTIALQKLLWIAKLNSFEQVNITVEEITKLKHLEKTRLNQHKKASKFTMIDLFRYPSLRWKTLALIIVQASIAFLYFAPNLILDDFQLNIFLNGLIYGLSTFPSTIGACYFIKQFKRKKYALACFFITLVWSVFLVIVYSLIGLDIPILTTTVSIFAFIAITFAMTSQQTFLLVHISELYPTQIRVLGISLVNLISAVILTVCSFIIQSASIFGFKIMMVFCIVAGIGFLFSFFLPETFDLKQKDYIEQIEAQMDRRIVESHKELPQTERQLREIIEQENK